MVGCSFPLYIWALGSPDIYLPEDVGFKLGTATQDFTHFIVEMHYHNHDLTAGVADNSGVRAIFSKVPKSLEAGILSIGDVLATHAALAAGE